MSLILTETRNHIGTITLQHYQRRNAISNDLVHELVDAFDQFETEKVRAVILKAEKDAKVWSSGHDVDELPTSGRDPLSYNDSLRRAVMAVERCPAPVIAQIEGSVWGGACELALSCDLIIVTPQVTFALTPARLGVPYNISGIQTFMLTVSLPVLKELLFTGKKITAERAYDLGIVNHIVDSTEIDDFVYAQASAISANSPLCISVMKEELWLLSNANPLSPITFERVQGLRRKVYDSEDYREGVNAFKEKRHPKFLGR